MNKTLGMIIVALAIISIKCEFELCQSHKYTGDNDEDECIYLTTATNYTHCCLLEADNESKCYQLTDDEFENIKNFKSYLKNTYSNVKIKCSADYLSFALLAFLIILF